MHTLTISIQGAANDSTSVELPDDQALPIYVKLKEVVAGTRAARRSNRKDGGAVSADLDLRRGMVPLPVVPEGPRPPTVGPRPPRDPGDGHDRRLAGGGTRPVRTARRAPSRGPADCGHPRPDDPVHVRPHPGLRRCRAPLPGRDLFVRTVPFFEWLHSHPRLRSRAETLAERDRRRAPSGGFLRPGPRSASRGQISSLGRDTLDQLVP
jgi:hypothetical protein